MDVERADTFERVTELLALVWYHEPDKTMLQLLNKITKGANLSDQTLEFRLTTYLTDRVIKD